MRYIKTIVLAAAAALVVGVLAQPARAAVSFELAFSNLSHHGSWLVSAEYGHVWQPRDYNRDWNPYYDGHWVYTDMGWAWVSEYEWGTIPYHYGTWVSDPRFGWVWIPGRVWAPSWVVFRTGRDYIGWAPVPPGYSVGMSIDFGGPGSFVFVSSRDFLAPRLRTSIIPAGRTSVFVNNTTVVNNIVIQNNVVINRGPDVGVVEKATRRTVRAERIESVARVAPFEHVSRAQLAVEPEHAKRGVRAAEPVPASSPLPVADTSRTRESSPAPAAGRGFRDDRPATREAVRTKQEGTTKAKSEPAVKVRPEAVAKAKPETAARTRPEAVAKAKPETAVKARPEAVAKAKPETAAKTRSDAKAKAIAKAKAKKDSLNKKKKTSEDDAPKDKDSTRR